MDNFQEQVKKCVITLADVFEPYLCPLPESKSGMYTIDTLYYVKKGAVLVFNSGSSFSPLIGPDFIGTYFILGQTAMRLNLEFKLLSGAEVYTIDIAQAKSLVSKYNLYESISYLIANRLYEFCNITEIYINPDSSAYKKVKICINLFYEHKDILGDSISLSTFIIECTGISKSRVMFILSELRKGGYITIENGKLLSVAKLPNEF
ncbi:helix-turn-helix domain-containing protein [Serratia oryzae]|uniref:helix-turn-helix domain-containing protein n=1 Tax=Serratia oryzae TaxID=2034155 RepID=UPI0012E1B82F|nr:helix-turn-helix domain-containing protein [Serratia oryzae]